MPYGGAWTSHAAGGRKMAPTHNVEAETVLKFAVFNPSKPTTSVLGHILCMP